MNRFRTGGMALHQAVSFSSLLMRIPQAEAVFWPGCALMNLDSDIFQKTLTIFRRAEPEIQLCLCCCGQPTNWLFPEKAEMRRQRLIALLNKQGVKRIYTACPNCTLQLQELSGFAVCSVWPTLAQCICQADLTKSSGEYIWHDPCPTKRDIAQQEAVRKLLKLADCAYTEPEHTGCHTLCCGNIRMMHILCPETAAGMRQRRLAQFPEEKTILSSCEGCLGAFRSEGRNTRHLLELLFGPSRKRGWANRLSITFK